MTANDVRWAEMHDWFVYAGLTKDGDYYIVVSEITEYADIELEFRDFEELSNWAGY